MNDNFLVKNNSIDDSWLNVDTDENLAFDNPIFNLIREPFYKENPHLLPVALFRNPDFLAYAVWVLFEIKLLPFQSVILTEVWNRPFPLFVASRGAGKTWLLALYALLRALFCPGYKIILVGAALRQSKLLFEYCEHMWHNAPIYRSLCPGSMTKKNIDKLELFINTSLISAIPVGQGHTIRGFRANLVIADEFDSHDVEIFERVIAGFGIVSHSPADNVIQQAKYEKLVEIGADIIDRPGKKSNQIIISGTAGYYFGPLYTYCRRYEAIVNSHGDPRLLQEIYSGEVPPRFDWRDYSVIRLPYQLLPDGFLDDKIIQRAKATMNPTIFSMEYEAVFAEDSDGFFKRSTIERAVASDKNVNGGSWIPWCPVVFEPSQIGSPKGRYVYGIDPASERDNLAIAILEVHSEHARLIHMWTTNKEDFDNRKRNGFTDEVGYNAFVARKIRSLMSVFPCEKMGMDMQGGGLALMEALHDPKHLKDGEDAIWLTIDYDDPKETDLYAGLHIVEPIQFAKYDWLYEANYGLAKDLETKKIILPRFDPMSLVLADVNQRERVTSFEKENPEKTLMIPDTMEDLFMEIEDLKDELCSIVIAVAGTGVAGRLQWKVPEVQLEGNKKGRGRKDRYSALLIANSIARKIYKAPPQEQNFYTTGMLAKVIDKPVKTNRLYSGPGWYCDQASKIYK